MTSLEKRNHEVAYSVDLLMQTWNEIVRYSCGCILFSNLILRSSECHRNCTNVNIDVIRNLAHMWWYFDMHIKLLKEKYDWRNRSPASDLGWSWDSIHYAGGWHGSFIEVYNVKISAIQGLRSLAMQFRSHKKIRKSLETPSCYASLVVNSHEVVLSDDRVRASSISLIEICVT